MTPDVPAEARRTAYTPGVSVVERDLPSPDELRREPQIVPGRKPGRDFVLSLACPDRRGIVHAVTGMVLQHDLTVVDSQQFGDEASGEFFLRMHLRSEGMPVTVEALSAAMELLGRAFSMQWSLHDRAHARRVIVLVSKQGHCLNDLLFRVRGGRLPIEIPAIVSNHEDFRSLADWYGIPFHHVPVTPETKDAAEDELIRLVDQYDADTLVLARYMQILSPRLCERYAGQIINIHHSLLPSFKGAKPYTQAHERGVKVIGATAHYVTSNLDDGPIIEQDFRRVDHRMSPVEMGHLGQELEAMALARAVKWHVEDRILLRGKRTIVFD